MKKTILLIIIVFLVKQISAQENIKTKVHKNIIKTDIILPSHYGLSKNNCNYSLTAERLLGKRFSIQFSYLHSNHNDDSYGYQRKYFELISDFKYFALSKSEHKGLYIGAFIRFLDCDERFYDIHDNNNRIEFGTEHYNLGGLIGYQLYLHNKIVLDLLTGIGGRDKYAPRILINEHNNSQFDYRLAFNVGYKF